jgi:hypothetical protein
VRVQSGSPSRRRCDRPSGRGTRKLFRARAVRADGRRTAYFVFDLPEPSAIPVFAEPFFVEMEAEVQFSPVMNGEDLQKGLSSLG